MNPDRKPETQPTNTSDVEIGLVRIKGRNGNRFTLQSVTGIPDEYTIPDVTAIQAEIAFYSKANKPKKPQSKYRYNHR